MERARGVLHPVLSARCARGPVRRGLHDYLHRRPLAGAPFQMEVWTLICNLGSAQGDAAQESRPGPRACLRQLSSASQGNDLQPLLVACHKSDLEPGFVTTCIAFDLRVQEPASNGEPISAYRLEKDDGVGGDFGIIYYGANRCHEASDLVVCLPAISHHRIRLIDFWAGEPLLLLSTPLMLGDGAQHSTDHSCSTPLFRTAWHALATLQMRNAAAADRKSTSGQLCGETLSDVK